MSMTAQEIKKHDAKLARLYKPVSADYGLKPCPFCGSLPASFKNPLWPKHWEVQCRTCVSVALGSFKSKQDAEAKWNKRA